MSIYAISDIHLGFFNDKTMDMFGQKWEQHTEKVKKNWIEQIKDDDLTLVPGDISWGTRLEEADVDLKWLDALPGKKVVVSGNHDYWWASTSLLNNRYKTIHFLRNSHFMYGGFAICGSRGWLCPNDTEFTSHDEKIYRREALRLKMSLDSAVRAGAEKIIVMLHYPPTNDKKEPSAFTEIINEYGVKTVVFGHLHGNERSKRALSGVVDGVSYNLVSADCINFKPIELVE